MRVVDLGDEIVVDPLWLGTAGRTFRVWKIDPPFVFAADTDETARPRNRAFPLILVRDAEAPTEAGAPTTTEGASDGRSVT